MTDTELKAAVRVDLEGNLAQGSERASDAMKKFSNNGKRHMSVLQRSARGADRTITKLGNRYVALATGGTMIAAGKHVSNLSKRLNQLGIDAGFNGDRLQQFKTDINQSISTAAIEFGVGAADIIAGVEEIVQKSGDIKFATDNIDNLAIAIAATGGTGADFGKILAELQKIGLSSPKEVLEVLDGMVAQGQQGAFVLSSLANLSDRVFAAYGPQNKKQILEMGVALQTLKDSTGSPEQAVTSFEALLATLTDGDKAAKLHKAGVKIFDDTQLTKYRKGLAPLSSALLPINEVLRNIATFTGGDKFKLSQVFDSVEATKGLKNLVNEVLQTGGTASLDKLFAVKTDGGQILKDAADNAAEFNNRLSSLRSIVQDFAVTNLSGPIQELADATGKIDVDRVQRLLEITKDVALFAGKAMIAYKVMKVGMAIKSGSQSIRAPAGALGGAAGAMTPTPVFVVNMGAGMGGAGKGAAAGQAAKAGKAAKVGKVARLAGGAGVLAGGAIAVVSAGAIGYELGALIRKTFMDGKGAGDMVGRAGASTLAFFGNDEAQAAIARMDAYDKQVAAEKAATNKLEITLKGDAAASARVDFVGGDSDITVHGESMGEY